jgi:hypothetical protein
LTGSQPSTSRNGTSGKRKAFANILFSIRVATMTDGVNTTLLYRKTEEDDWKPVITTNFKESFSPQFFHFRQQKLYGLSNIGRDRQ